MSLRLPYLEQVNFYGSSSINLPVQVLFAWPLEKPPVPLWAVSCLFMSSLKHVAQNYRLHVSRSCTWHTTLLSMLLRMIEGLYCSSSLHVFRSIGGLLTTSLSYFIPFAQYKNKMVFHFQNMASHLCNFTTLLNSIWMIVYKYLSSTDQPLQNALHILVTYSNQGVWLSVPECKSAQSHWKLSDFFFFFFFPYHSKSHRGWRVICSDRDNQ